MTANRVKPWAELTPRERNLAVLERLGSDEHGTPRAVHVAVVGDELYTEDSDVAARIDAIARKLAKDSP